MAFKQDSSVQRAMPECKKEELTALWDSRQLAKAQQQPSHVIEALEALLVDTERQLKEPSPDDVWSNLVVLMQTAEAYHWDVVTFPAITRSQLKDVMEMTYKKNIYLLRELPMAEGVTTPSIDEAVLDDDEVYVIAPGPPPSLYQLEDVNLLENQQKQAKVFVQAAQEHTVRRLRKEGYKGVKRMPENLLDQIKLPVRPDGMVVAAGQAILIHVCCCITVASVLQMAATVAKVRQLQSGGSVAVQDLKGRRLSGALFGILYTNNMEHVCEMQRISEHYSLQIWLWKPKRNGWVRFQGRPDDPGDPGQPGQPSWLDQLELISKSVFNVILGKGATGTEASDMEVGTLPRELIDIASKGGSGVQIEASTALDNTAAGSRTATAALSAPADAHAYTYATSHQPPAHNTASTGTRCLAAVQVHDRHRTSQRTFPVRQAGIYKLWSPLAGSYQLPRRHACSVSSSGMAPQKPCTYMA